MVAKQKTKSYILIENISSMWISRARAYLI
jgi:hypothetical protein